MLDIRLFYLWMKYIPEENNRNNLIHGITATPSYHKRVVDASTKFMKYYKSFSVSADFFRKEAKKMICGGLEKEGIYIRSLNVAPGFEKDFIRTVVTVYKVKAIASNFHLHYTSKLKTLFCVSVERSVC